jgi:hypothetical protein
MGGSNRESRVRGVILRRGRNWTSVQVTARISEKLLPLIVCGWRHTVE